MREYVLRATVQKGNESPRNSFHLCDGVHHYRVTKTKDGITTTYLTECSEKTNCTTWKPIWELDNRTLSTIHSLTFVQEGTVGIIGGESLVKFLPGQILPKDASVIKKGKSQIIPLFSGTNKIPHIVSHCGSNLAIKPAAAFAK